MRLRLVLVWGFVLLSSQVDAAEKQLKPFVALIFGGGTTILDLEDTSARSHAAIGIGGAMLWDIFGFDVDAAHVPGVFQSGNQTLVVDSSVTTVTGSVIITLPRRMTEYVLRPYFVGGGGFMRVRIDDVFEALPVRKTLPAFNVGGGATGFVSNRWGVCWDVRYFRGSSRDTKGLSIGSERLSFWRASMAVVLRLGA
jgi:hypothetical protein